MTSVPGSISVNFVMSDRYESEIFRAILGYFRQFLPSEVSWHISVGPLPGMDIYHYHRPHLEAALRANAVVTVHHDLCDPRFDLAALVGLYRQAACVVCLNTLQDAILRRAGISQTAVIPHGFNAQVFCAPPRPKERKSGAKLVLGFVARRYEADLKGESYLAELMRRLDRRAVTLSFVGFGRSESAWLAHSLGLDAVARETPPYAIFPDLYRSFDLLLVTSLWEGGPASVPEAGITATPIVGRDVGMIHDVVEHGVNGLLLCGTPSVDAAMLAGVAHHEDGIATQLFHGAFARVDRFITWEENVRRHVALYREICAGHPPA
jgi:glycosyltransferase involved in cell wall biosynthesis